MGYTTDFFGSFTLDKPLDPALKKYLIKFNESRRMKRNVRKLPKLIPIERNAFYQAMFGGFGTEGEYFVDGVGYMGQDGDASILEHNTPPSTQPSLWCQWIPSHDGLHIEWDGNEKFYEYVEWLQYICDKFLAPKGYVLNGSVRYQGEDTSDAGWVVCENNQVRLSEGKLVPIKQVTSKQTKKAPKAMKPIEPVMLEIPKRKVNY